VGVPIAASPAVHAAFRTLTDADRVEQIPSLLARSASLCLTPRLSVPFSAVPPLTRSGDRAGRLERTIPADSSSPVRPTRKRRTSGEDGNHGLSDADR
jgi:hypothetical protein